MREVKMRADNTCTQANRLANIARDIHALHARPLGPSALVGDSRVDGIQQTALAFKKHALDMGYSRTSWGPRREDAADVGQEIFEDFLLIDLT